MKIHKECQVEKVASKDATRTSLAHPYLQGNTIIATNGIAMVQIPVKERSEHDVDGWVTGEALKAARKAASRQTSCEISANGSLALSNGQSFPRPNESTVKGKWPNCGQVWDPCWAREIKFAVSLSAEQLIDIAKAMGTEGVTLEITGETDPIRIRPCTTRAQTVPVPEAKALLMPIRTR